MKKSKKKWIEGRKIGRWQEHEIKYIISLACLFNPWIWTSFVLQNLIIMNKKRKKRVLMVYNYSKSCTPNRLHTVGVISLARWVVSRNVYSWLMTRAPHLCLGDLCHSHKYNHCFPVKQKLLVSQQTDKAVSSTLPFFPCYSTSEEQRQKLCFTC